MRLKNEIALITAWFHDLITEGTMPTGRSFSAFLKLRTAASSEWMATWGAGFHRSNAGNDHFVVNLRAVIAAVTLNRERRVVQSWWLKNFSKVVQISGT